MKTRLEIKTLTATVKMASSSEAASIERHNTCCFPLALILLVGGFIFLQSYGFIQLSPLDSYNGSRLCHVLPESDSCTPTTDNSSLSKGNFFYYILLLQFK